MLRSTKLTLMFEIAILRDLVKVLILESQQIIPFQEVFWVFNENINYIWKLRFIRFAPKQNLIMLNVKKSSKKGELKQNPK